MVGCCSTVILGVKFELKMSAMLTNLVLLTNVLDNVSAGVALGSLLMIVKNFS